MVNDTSRSHLQGKKYIYPAAIIQINPMKDFCDVHLDYFSRVKITLHCLIIYPKTYIEVTRKRYWEISC